jgi:hypothetical protein
MTIDRRAARGIAALLLAALLAPPPAAARTPNPCSTALQQQLQNIAKLHIQLDDAYIQLAAQRTNAIRDTCVTASGQNQKCMTQVNARFDALRRNLDDQGTNLDAAAAKARNDFGASNCPWSAQEITQMVATIGQTTAQITQSIAQVVSAAKGNGGGSSGGKPGDGSTTPPPPAPPPAPTPTPAPPANPAPPSTPAPPAKSPSR